MNEVRWRDGRHPRGRYGWLLLIEPGDVVRSFEGKDIPGVCRILGQQTYRAGKWTSTEYVLAIADGVRTIAGVDGWDTGTFAEGLGLPLGERRWTAVANCLGVSVAAAQAFLRDWRPRAAEALDRVEAALEEIDRAAPVTGAAGAEETVISWGFPTNRQIAAGYWHVPIYVYLGGREIAQVRRHPDVGWHQPVVEPADAPVRVLGVQHTGGYHGGAFSVRLAVPEGAQVSRTREERS